MYFRNYPLTTSAQQIKEVFENQITSYKTTITKPIKICLSTNKTFVTGMFNKDVNKIEQLVFCSFLKIDCKFSHFTSVKRSAEL
uniref:Uncharacterized protein n=1 Tax=Trichobilharzia regenti TaxID=157069 RepID=A0AA85JZ54_TRIRE|nr:unnamed protein product [Trichobilharzia regenti]